MQTVTKEELEWLLIPDKTNIKTKIVTRHTQKRHYIMVKGSIHPYINIYIYIYIVNNKAPKYVIHKTDKMERINA